MKDRRGRIFMEKLLTVEYDRFGNINKVWFSSLPARNPRGFLSDKLPYLFLYQNMPINTSLSVQPPRPFGARGPTFGAVQVSARSLPTLSFASIYWPLLADLTPDNRKATNVGS